MGAFAFVNDSKARSLCHQSRSKPIPLTWSYRVKKENGKFVKFKARLCLRGDLQKNGSLAEKDLYSPVIRQDSLRLLLSHALQQGFTMNSYDVPCAYLFAKPSQPTVVYAPSQLRDRGRFMQLKKNLYGGIESAQTWNNHLHERLTKSMGLTQSSIDPCVYFNDDRTVIIMIYVDDALLLARDDSLREHYDQQLINLYNIKCNGPLKHFLGVEYSKDGNNLFLSQSGTIKDLAAMYNRPSVPTATTPYRRQPKNGQPFDLSKTTSDPTAIKQLFIDNKCDLPRLVGSLLHIAKNTRPDIETAVSRIARYVSKPSEEVIQEGLHVLDYLNNTTNLGLHIRPHDNQPIEAYVDSSYMTENSTHGCSRYGYVVYINGTPITTKSTHHISPSYSTTEAEYIALGQAHRTIIPINHLLAEIRQLPLSDETFQNNLHLRLHEDNKPTISVIEKKQIQQSRLRTTLGYQYKLREDFDSGYLTISSVKTADQLADIFTKCGQTKAQFANIRNFLVRPQNDETPVEFRDNNNNTENLKNMYNTMYSPATTQEEDGGNDNKQEKEQIQNKPMTATANDNRAPT